MKMNFDAGESLEQARDRWALEVGRFVMAFGAIEASTYQALREFPSEPIADALIDLHLRTRISVLLEICRARNTGPWKEFADALEGVHALNKKRNLIAHNSMGFDVFLDANGEYHMEQAISNAKKLERFPPRKRDNVLFEELVKHREEAEELSVALSVALPLVLRELGKEVHWEADY
jgi:hypothetical protein